MSKQPPKKQTCDVLFIFVTKCLAHATNSCTAARQAAICLFLFCNWFNFNFILPKVNTDYIRQAQVLNIDNLRLIIYLCKCNEKHKITQLKHQLKSIKLVQSTCKCSAVIQCNLEYYKKCRIFICNLLYFEYDLYGNDLLVTGI